MAQTYRGIRWFLEDEPSSKSPVNFLHWPECRFWRIPDDDEYERSLSITLRDLGQECHLRNDELVELEFDLLEGYEADKHDHAELEARMWRILREKDIEHDYRSLFQVTTPLWFGLWIHSPLNAPQCYVLARLLREIWQGEIEEKDKRAFLNALDVAHRGCIPLHVTALPPGHVDLGWKTIFTHCPRCKADPPLGDPSNMLRCNVCGHSYIPRHTSSSTRWDLQAVLGQLAQRSG